MDKLIYIVDDNSDHHFLLYKALKRLPDPCTVLFFEDGKNLLQQLQLTRQSNLVLPALIIMDLNMPGMNGLQLVKQLKCHTEHSQAPFGHIPVVIMSSETTASKIQKCYQAGANAFIEKPFGFEKMQAALKCLCEFWLELNLTAACPS